jgi:hypothetical protein
MTTIFPIDALSDERRALGMAVAVLVGIAFGFVLERSGFGRAQKLVGQFYGNDLTVLKVMFTAVVTAMLGLVVLSSVGIADLEAMQFNYPTYLWPMIVGGLLLGAGFVTSGYCPGTSLVATASGKLDGAATVLGVVAGGLVYAHVEPALGTFPNSGKLGALSLSEWLGLPAPVVAAFVVAIAIAAFLGGERIERIVAGGTPEGAAPGAARKWIFVGLVAVALAGVAMLALPTGTSAAP